MRKLSKTAVFVLVLTLVMGSISGLAAAQTKTITLYHAFTSNTLLALRNLINDFQKENPNIKVKAEYVGDALIQKLQAAVAAGNPPDISWLHSGEHAEFARGGAIYKIQDFMEGPNGLTQEEIDDFFPIMKSYMEYNYDGQWWGLPVNATTMTFVYNKDMIRAAGIDPDNLNIDTWEDFAKVTSQISNPAKGEWGMFIPVFSGGMSSYFDWFFRPFIWAAGGKYVNDDLTTVAFDSPEAKKAVQFFYDLMHEYQGGTISPGAQAFEMGKVAFTLEGPWSIPGFNRLRFDWGAALYPLGPSGERFQPSAGEPVVIFKDAKNPDEAWEFIKFWIRPDNMAKWAITSGYLPTRRSVLEDPLYKTEVEKTPGLEIFVQGLEYGFESETTPAYNRVVDIYANAVELIMNQKIGIDEGLEEAAAEANAAIAQYWLDNPEEYKDLMERLPNRNK
ncbi:MAG: ABC transporter substrate-binding protein [Firmicutes bacterium]|nr:ABC transporter substrate-binding protein [Bacillota bacterium]